MSLGIMFQHLRFASPWRQGSKIDGQISHMATLLEIRQNAATLCRGGPAQGGTMNRIRIEQLS
jgi:hypothetical protein